jgi:cytoskeletal protein RodZ
MYEQNRVSIVGRILWLIVSLLVLVALVWLFLWLLFWRHPKVAQVTDTAKKGISTTVQSGSDAIKNAANDVTINTPSNTASTSTTPSTTSTTTTQSSTAQESNRSSANATSTPTSTSAQASSTATQTPSAQLANTGAGSMLLPVVVAVVGGAAAYHVRLRRKEA